jgi:hypothetical protein
MVRLELDDITQTRDERHHQDTTQEPQHPAILALPLQLHPPHVPAHHASPPPLRQKKQPRPPLLPLTARRCLPLPRSSCSSFSPSISLSPSPTVPERTRRLLDLPPTRLPGPHQYGHRKRRASRVGNREPSAGGRSHAHARIHLPIAPVAALELLHFIAAVGGAVTGMHALGSLVVPLPAAHPSSDAPRGTGAMRYCEYLS